MAESNQADFIVMKTRSPSLSDKGARRAAVNRQYKRFDYKYPIANVHIAQLI